MNVDVAIVGGGAIGASLAIALQPLSLTVALIEAVPPSLRLEDEFDVRSLSLSPSSQRIFASLGLWQSLKKEITPIEHIHVSDKGNFWVNRFHAAAEGLPALGYMIEFSHLNRILTSACQNNSNVHYFCPAEVEAIERDAKGVTLSMINEGKSEKIHARLIIAADGSYSKIRQLHNIKFTEWDYGQSALVATVGLARDHKNTAYERFTSKGPMALLPLSKRRSALVWSIPNDEINRHARLSSSEFLSALQAHFGYRLGRFVKMGKPSVFPLKMILSKKNTGPSLILIGNASQTIHPVAGQGFNLGLRDVAAVVSTLSDAIKNEMDIASSDVLQQYENWRTWDRRQMLVFSDALTRLYSTNFWAHSILRTFCMVAVNSFSPAKQLLLNHTMGISGRLPDLVCGVAAETS